MRALPALAACLLASTALAQTRQPAQITTNPSASAPQTFDLLDKAGNWAPLGSVTNAGVVNEVWSDNYRASSGSDCGSVKAAYAKLRSVGGTIRLPSRVLSMGSDCQILIDGAAVQFLGQGWSESNNLGDNPSTTPRTGTWFDVSDTTKSLFLISTTSGAGTTFDDLAITENPIQPAPGAGAWTPVVVPPVINATATGGNLRVRHVYCDGVYACVKGYTMGRLEINGLFGEAFSSMVDLDYNLDVPWIDNVHDWDFWSKNKNVMAWLNQNSDTLLLGRVDGPMVGRVFGINKRSTVHFRNLGNGVVTRGFFGQIYSDGTKWSVWQDGTAQAVNAHFGMVDGLNQDNSLATPAAFADGALFKIDKDPGFSLFQVDQARSASALSVLNLSISGGNIFSFGSLWADSWGASSPMIATKNDAANPSLVTVGRFFTIAPPSSNLSNATTDRVTLSFQNTWGAGFEANSITTQTFSQPISLTSGKGVNLNANAGPITATSTGQFLAKAGGNVTLQSGAAANVVLGPGGTSAQCGMWIQNGFALPGLSDASSAGCVFNLGSSAQPMASITTNLVTAKALPTSAGAGGLYVCVDSAGVMYKKATCP